MKSLTPSGPNYAPEISDGRFCYDFCDEPVACCVDGTCIGDNITRIQCEFIYGGKSFAGVTCENGDISDPNLSCCEYIDRTGA